MPKVVLSVNTSWNVVNFRSGLIKALRSRGYEVSVVAPKDDHSAKVTDLGCRYIAIEMDNAGMSPFRDLHLAWSYWRIIRQERPNVFIGFTIKPNIFGSVSAYLNGVPVINNISGLGTAFVRGGFLRKLVQSMYRCALYRSKWVFFQNDDDRVLFVDEGIVREEQTLLLPGSGVNLDHFSPAVDETPRLNGVVFILVARLLWDKGVGEFVEAARLVREKMPTARFQLLGFLDVENRTAVPRNRIEQWVDEGLVEFLGSTDDVRPFLQAADCVVLPSYREGTPRSLLEGGAMAKPLIATNVPGCKEVVDHAENGFLCRPRDAEDLASKMVEFAAMDYPSRISMGQKSRRKIETQFSETIVIEKYLSAIQQIIKAADS
ncbi:glycosyltransferase family 4 protein [Mesorhizobium sp.]|uniref:glycosyltransferase family 4 protein n=1 Tax=Mesorhizobium sp. TaxID=1871066 RepID=UPI000FE429CC|nr:glycosyltransferase family 4 protein [Mesorhizobium sp.]RWP27944.1 MAG: glycosyltransferase family 1 protein [Mesorhizobium sp.]RWP69430.1 MAG: glycosyltransferase family 1 protein [Mesorhizobium sp.]RWQ14463.1 MAG: glycosyltransferase family 1 protein [Mesorhizobium sp.]